MPNLFSKIASFNGKITLYSGGDQLKSLVSVYDVARCMEFVGESEKINKEIYNCVNENLTVKEVADVCKKVNKNLLNKYKFGKYLFVGGFTFFFVKGLIWLGIFIALYLDLWTK